MASSNKSIVSGLIDTVTTVTKGFQDYLNEMLKAGETVSINEVKDSQTNAKFTTTMRANMTLNRGGRGYTKRYMNQSGYDSIFKSAFDPNALHDSVLTYGYFNKTSAKDLYVLINDVSVGESEWVHFDRWYSVDLDKEDISGRHYIFMCRPDLYLLEENTKNLSSASKVSSDGFFQYISKYHPMIISSLTGSFDLSEQRGAISSAARACGSGLGNAATLSSSVDNDGNILPIHTFIPIITGRAESLQLPDLTIKNYELTQPYTKYTIPYAASAIESQTGGTFDLTLKEDQEFTMHKLFYAWIYYMDGVMRNKFRPKDKYIIYNALDYATSIYDIVVDATGENIIWWAKYTGCIPLTSPTSDLSFNLHSAPDAKCTIPFAYFHCEQNNIAALLDFNTNSLGYTYMRNTAKNNGMNPKVPVEVIYNQTVNYSKAFLGRSQVGRPVIFAKENDRILKLRWMPYTL